MTTAGSRDALPRAVSEVLDTAIGAVDRHDPNLPRSGGPAGNARLTAWVGVLLLALFLVEMFTLLGLQQMVSVHIVVGTVLVPLALLKTATTGWRILRYYTGNDAYRRAGPPPLLLRLLGPFVILTSLAVLGSGLALVSLGDHARDLLFTAVGQRIDAVTIHKICFVLWLAVTGLHTLVRLVPSARLVSGRAGPVRVAGGSVRAAIIAVTLLAGVIGGVVTLHASGAWTFG